jgi:hypothetical protein
MIVIVIEALLVLVVLAVAKAAPDDALVEEADEPPQIAGVEGGGQ